MRGVSRVALASLVTVLVALVLASGCSDTETIVTVIELDFVAEIPATEVQAIELRDPERPLDQAEVLHLGTTGIEAASMLMTFDFSVLAHPDSAYLLPYLVPENIASVDLYLQHLEWYESTPADSYYHDPYRRDWPGLDKVYEVHELESVLDAWPAPGPEPAYLPANVCLESEVVPLEYRRFSQLDEAATAGWIAARQPVGLIVREGAGSDPGIEGFASHGLLWPRSVLPWTWYGQQVGPQIRLRLIETPDSWSSARQYWNLVAAWDATTWHRVPEPPGPDDDFIMAGQIGRLHVLRFTLPDTLPLSRLQRAELAVTTDADSSVGPSAWIRGYDVRRSMADSAAAVWTLDELAAATHECWWFRVEPEHPEQQVHDLDITRWLDELEPGREHRLAWLVGGCEPRTSRQGCSRTWQFVYNRPVILGPGRSVHEAPRLRLTFRR